MRELLKSIRSLITFLICATFCILALRGAIDPKDYVIVVTVVIGYYFTVKGRPDEQKPQNGSGNGEKV